MRLSDFNYNLPPELIAQHPLPDRSSSRLLVLHQNIDQETIIEDKQFTDLLELLKPNDLLIFNDTKVIPARLFGRKESTQKNSKPNSGGSQSEVPQDQLPVTTIVLIIALIWAATGFYIVDQGSRGVVLRFGKNTEVTMPGPRWHIPFPVESVEVVNLEQVRTLEVGYRSSGNSVARSKELRESLMLTDDENIIDLQFAVQYNLKSAENFLFNNRSADASVRGAAESAIREIVGKSKMDFALYEGREEIAVKAKKLMQEILDRYDTGINVTSVTMQNAQPPEQVQASFDDAVKQNKI